MNDTVLCPDCGHRNPPGAASCENCGFPLVEPAGPDMVAGPPAPGAGEVQPAPPAPARPAAPRPAPFIPRPPRRPPRAPGSGMALSLWLFVGGFAAVILIFVAIKANVDRATQPVEGSSEEQQKRANELQEALSRDSTDIEARQKLADIYYDTGNWSEAIVHYRSVIRRDSTRTTALVDLGVCYYNLGDSGSAERMFQLALVRDPHQPIALFNLGIVNERREDYDAALRYFHSAMQSDPPEELGKAVLEAMQRIQQRTGRQAPPLNQ